jgi:DNA repair protein SbcC/Rad50
MIIKKIILENIRSYENQEIVFPKGSTLLAGDIGSGKTSILLAIEFGLFGLQPGQRGSVLLRNGEDLGKVILEFEVDGIEVIVERTLKKGKTISQDYSSISINGEKQELSVTELKQRILNILKYPSEFAKKQNLLYKFTVYTPQEEMKQIILEDPTSRLNTLRHVFGIDKYKTILENANLLRLKLREEKRLLEGITSSLEDDLAILKQKETFLIEKKENIFSLQEDLLLKIEIRKNKEKDIGGVKIKQEEKSILQQEQGKSKIMLFSKKDTFDSNEKLIQSIQTEIGEFKNFNFNESRLFELEEEILELKKEKEKINSNLLEVNSNSHFLKLKKQEAEKIQQKMSNLEICPTCNQNVDAVYRANILNKAHNDISSSKNTIDELELEKKRLSEKIKNKNLEISFKERELTDLKILKMKLEGINEKQKRVNDLLESNLNLKKDLEMLEKHVSTLNDSILELSKYDAIYKEKEKELSEAYKEERKSDISLAESKKEIEVFEKSINELKTRIEKIKGIKVKLNYISELEMWMTKKFISVVAFIEKNVMVSLKHEFSKLFSDWFQILVPDNFNVQLSDTFTPIIEQQDYEIDYTYLSGGERTAIALAYRLALNQVINSLMSKIKTKDLVILDEPTDGFSSQQLDKMREVLDQLNVKQLIIVSHEQKIESFVENVIKFKKDYGISLME